MRYLKNEVPVQNNTLSLFKVDNETVMISIDGEIKTLVCNYDVLNEVLNMVDGTNTFEKIESIFSQQYGLDAVENFLAVLLDEEIIKVKSMIGTNYVYPKTCIIGSGNLLENTRSVFETELDIVKIMSIDEALKDSFKDYEAIIIVPDIIRYREIIMLNKLLVNKGTPFFLFYYNGKKLVLGPFVFPWKTPCFQCHITHHLKILNKNNSNYLNLDDLYELMFSHGISDEFSELHLQYLASVISNEVKKISEERAIFSFVESEIFIGPNESDFSDKKIYRPITDCGCCHGMNKQYHDFNRSLADKIAVLSEPENVKIKYDTAGFRSLSEEQTENLVNSVLDNVGIDIEIRRVYDNPFSSIIPVCDSLLKTTHKNKTPYFLKEQNSHGKGINEKQAYFSAAFEIFERLSARYYGETEIIRGSVNEVSPYSIDLERFIEHNLNNSHGYEKYSRDVPIDWVWGKSLITGKPKLVPASMVFLSDAVFRGQFYGSSSSGLAAGATLEDAILQALFEIVEHDAWMIGQANPISLPIIENVNSKNSSLKESIIEIEKIGYKVISRDYTNDIGIPVIRTWIVNPNNYSIYATNGFGASISVEVAYERSVTEAVQSADPEPLKRINKYKAHSSHYLINCTDSLYGLHYFQQKDISGSDSGVRKDMMDYKCKEYNSVSEILNDVISRIRLAIPNCDIVFVNLTSEVFGIPVVRVIVTDDIQRINVPLLAPSPRLFDFQRKMGYSDSKPSYEELFMGPYPH